MNRAVVRRASHGLARYLNKQLSDAGERGVVIGYDGRRCGKVFAHETAAVLLAAGLRVHLFDTLCPTPLVAYGVLRLGAAAGVMVTASHNPPDYNGYQVYADNGAQIIEPMDRGIAQGIDEAPAARDIPVADLDEARSSGRLQMLGSEMNEAYLEAIGALAPEGGEGRDLVIAYTALHGVGEPLIRQVLGRAGFSNVHSVASQAQPDGTFPTVDFPNPEEPGAMDLVTALAVDKDAAIIIANDPDADRLSVCVKTGAGQYQQLTGNQVGVLLGHDVIQRELAAGTAEGALVIASLVSSPWLGRIASDLGVAYAETLTGFKWIATSRCSVRSSTKSASSSGTKRPSRYAISTVARDKDGISAALVLAALAARLHAEEKTLLDELELIARRHGFFGSKQRSLRFEGIEGKAKMDAVMSRVRQQIPTSLAGHAVERYTDLLGGVVIENGNESPMDGPRGDVVILALAGGHRVIARPSGTEPKIKLYFDVRQEFNEGMSSASVEASAAKTIAELERPARSSWAWLNPAA